MFFACKLCSAPLSADLVPADIGVPALDEDQVGFEYPPSGYFSVGPPDEAEIPIYPTIREYVALNARDLINVRQDSARTSGCCGSGGLSGLNLQCSNQHPVGVVFSECWHPFHYVLLDPERVVASSHSDRNVDVDILSTPN